MGFRFGGPPIPVTLRVARSLLLLQAAIMVLAGVFVMVVAGLLGNQGSIAFGGASLTGGAATVLGAGYAALGVVSLVLGIVVGRAIARVRIPVIALEVVVAALFMAHASLSVTTGVGLLVCVAVVALVLSPSAGRAAGEAGQVPREHAAPTRET